MYAICTDLADPQSPQNILLKDLIDAKNRGLAVKVYLDKSIPFGSSNSPSRQDSVRAKNETAYCLLAQAGIDVQYVTAGLCLHDKLIIIDEETVISGSANWTYSALKRNSENCDLIRSREYARIKLANIADLKTVKEPSLSPAYIYKLKVSNSFLSDPKLCPRMVNKSQGTLFDLYLFLLKSGQDHKISEFPVDYQSAAAVVGLSPEHWRSPYEINRLLKKLAIEYKLIEVEFRRGFPAGIKLAPLPEKAYFNIPYAYWDYGWSKLLSLRAKFMFLINIYKQETSDIKPWWSLGREILRDDFYTSVDTITRGMRELERFQIVDIWRGRLPDKQSPFTDKPVNLYLLKPLPSPESIKQAWEALEQAYGREAVLLARKLAALIAEENNYEVLGKFIELINAYGYNWTESAAKITAKLSGQNPARNVFYTEGILKRWSDQGHPD